MREALAAWGEVTVLRPLEGGYRNRVWLVERGGQPYVAKTTRRTEAQVRWLLPVQQAAREAGFAVPNFVESEDGSLVSDGLTLESFLSGSQISPSDLARVEPMLRRFHALTGRTEQRPLFASSQTLLSETRGGDVDLSQMPPDLVLACREAWRALRSEPRSAVHGDPNPSNLLYLSDGRIGLVDWDEARVDVSRFDLITLLGESATPADRRACDAWEIAVCWQVEPDHARNLATRFSRET